MSTSNIPNSISPADLEKLQGDAPLDVSSVNEIAEELTSEEEQRFDGKTADEIVEIAESFLDKMSKEVKHPIVHKVAMFSIIQNMVAWHKQTAENLFHDGDHECAEGWLLDAGKFQAIANILMNIEIGANDFTCQ